MHYTQGTAGVKISRNDFMVKYLEKDIQIE